MPAEPHFVSETNLAALEIVIGRPFGVGFRNDATLINVKSASENDCFPTPFYAAFSRV